VDGRDAAAARGARRDGGHARRCRTLALASAKGGNEEDDDGDVIVTHCGPLWSAARCGARLVALLVGRDWAGRRRQAERLTVAHVGGFKVFLFPFSKN
jgi:hypothetical protein